MKRHIIVFVILLSVCGNISAQKNIKNYFVEMPDTMLPLLSTNARLDLVDFYEAGMRAIVTNRLDGKSELLKLEPDFLELKTSASASMQMKMLSTLNGDTILCVVTSACAEACNSNIRFYDKGWRSLQSDRFFDKPQIREFFIESDSIDKAIAISDIYLVKLSLSADSDSLHAEYTMPDYMMQEDSCFVASRIRTICYSWSGRRFIGE